MSMPANFPLTLYRGDSRRWEFRLWADAAKTQAVDLSGVVAAAEIRDQSAGAIVAVLECTVAEPNLIIGRLVAAESRKLPVPTGFWDLRLTYPTGDVVTILAGPVTVTADITNSGAEAMASNVMRLSRPAHGH